MDTPSDAEVRSGRTFEQVLERVIELCDEKLQCGRPNPDEVLSERGINSLYLVELLMFIEEEFDVVIPTTQEKPLTTLRKIAEFVWRALKPPEPEPGGNADEQPLPWGVRARWLTRIYHVDLGEVDSEAAYLLAVEETLLPVLRRRLARDIDVSAERITLTLSSRKIAAST